VEEDHNAISFTTIHGAVDLRNEGLKEGS